jgi:hypothetical protein
VIGGHDRSPRRDFGKPVQFLLQAAGLSWGLADWSWNPGFGQLRAPGQFLSYLSLERGEGGVAPDELKTESSKRTLAMPLAVRAALLTLRKEQATEKLRLGEHYLDRHDLVFRDDADRPADVPPAHERAVQACLRGGRHRP